MNFIIDAHLLGSISRYFEGHDVIHTTSLVDGNYTTDNKINEISLLEKRVSITKDSDFYYSFIAYGKPFKIVLVKLGNLRLREINRYFETNADALVQLLQNNYFVILERERMRVLQ